MSYSLRWLIISDEIVRIKYIINKYINKFNS
jgi:hypothetical protein